MKNPLYTIVAGVNGVGKSSFTGVLKSLKNDLGVIINADDIRRENNCSAIGAGKVALKRIDECLAGRVSFTQETTLSGKKTVNTAKIAKEKGYRIRMFYISLSSVEESLMRIKSRVEKGGHDIPADDVKRRYESKFADIKKILPYCDEVCYFDNDGYEGFRQI